MSDIGPQRDLFTLTSFEGVEKGNGRLGHLQGRRIPPGVPLGTPELVAYLCGALPPIETATIEERLIATRTAVRQLRLVRMELLHLEAMPWQAVAEAAQGNGPTSEVATAWLALASAQMQAAERAPARWRTTGWQRLRSQVETGIGEALAAWNSFLAFGAQWNQELQASNLFAMARGAEAGIEVRMPGVATPFPAEARIDSDDSLHVLLQVPASLEDSDPTFNGQNVLLALRNGGEIWPLATAPIIAGRAEWRIPDFGAATGISANEIPLAALQLSFADVKSPSSTDPRLRLLAERTDREGHPIDGGLIPIIFSEEPRWSGGVFLARVEIPEETRHWLTSGYQLRLDVAVSGTHWQHLGAWTLVEGDDAPHTLQAPCPGSLDVILPSVTLIRAQFRPPE